MMKHGCSTTAANGNTYTDWYSFDTFHPTFQHWMLGQHGTTNQQAAVLHSLNIVLQEIPDTDKEVPDEECLGNNSSTQWEDR